MAFSVFNKLKRGDPHGTGSPLVQVMVCRPSDTEILAEPMMRRANWTLGTQFGEISIKKAELPPEM